jgi:CheY-like chemotaxis protein
MNIKKIMMIDDEDDIRTIGKLSLHNVGKWEAVMAPSGSEALKLLETEKPDVILLDVMMPGLDGPATLARIREIESMAAVPVIFMTAKVQRQEVEQYMRLGAAGVISKPFDPMKLPEEIRKIVGTGPETHP